MNSSRESSARHDRSARLVPALGRARNHSDGLRAHQLRAPWLRRAGLVTAIGGFFGGVFTASTAHGQIVGTGGSTATTGSLTTTDFFIGAQKEQNANLNDRDRANFLNQASCYCQKPVWVKAILQPSANARAALVPATATVSLYVGTACDQNLVPATCLPLSTGTPFSQFRLNGLLVQTTVNVLARQYSTNYPWDRTSPQGDTRTDSCVATTTDYCATATATGGASGTGGTSGSGGASGAGGNAGAGAGSGGATGSGGVSGTGGATGTITGASAQGIYLFVSTTGEGYHDIANVQIQWVLDMTPPCPPTNLTLAPADQALIASWTAIDATLSGNDLLGYQILCTRGLETDTGLQVFKSGTFTAAFDDRCASGGSPFTRVDSAFICSDLLSSAATSARLKILENGIKYGVGVLAVDHHRNGSLLTPKFDHPVETEDFYGVYRGNDPQGQAQGGFCSVEPTSRDDRSRGGLALGLGSLVVGCGLAFFGRRRSVARRRRP